MKTSYSALDTFKICPLKYKYQVVERRLAPKRIEAVFGTLIHSALKFMFERNPLYPTLDEVINFFTQKFNEKAESVVFSDAKTKEAEEKMYFEEGVRMLKNFYKKNQPWNFNALELETRFSLDLEDEKTNRVHTLSGIIDRIDKNEDDESYEIIDYKTAKKMPAESTLEDNLQLNLYHLALSKRWPSITSGKIKLSLYFLKHNEKISLTPNQEVIKKARESLLSTIREVEEKTEKDDFPPMPGPLCSYCGFRPICPMWSHEYKVEKNEPDEKMVVSAIDEFFELKDSEEKNKDRLSELREIIIGYMDKEKVERVFGGGGFITRTNQERVSYDLEKLRPELEAHGHWQKLLVPDAKKLEEISAELTEEELQAVKSAKIVKKFATLKSTKKKGSSDEE
jgi:CRISPR/Cas system-associated exonuclease Cas4 (RecB family)